MKMSKLLREKLDAAKQTDEFWMDSAKLDFALSLEKRRKQMDKSYKDIAIALGKSPAYISKVFRGDANLTIESMVKLSRSLGCNINIALKEISEDKNNIKEVAKRLELDMQEFKANNTMPPTANSLQPAYYMQNAA